MLRRVLLVVSAVCLFAGPALAGRAKIPALEAGTVRAEPKADAAAVVEVKKGDQLMVLGKKGDWSQVMTNDGKKGWVLNKLVSSGGLSSLDANATTVAAVEGDTAIAMRGRPATPRTVIVGMGGLDSATTRKLSDLIAEPRKLKVIETRDEANTRTGSPAGGLAGATELTAKSEKAEILVAVQKDGEKLAFEVVDVKNQKVLGTGSKANVEEIAAEVGNLTAELTKNPAEAAATATPAPATKEKLPLIPGKTATKRTK